MQGYNIFALAVALAMDAFAVSIAVGLSLKNVSFRQTFRLSFHFGLFQGMMPVLGWSIGVTIRSYVAAFDHWLAFALLLLVGGNMIKGAFRTDQEKESGQADPTKGLSLVILSLATSLDALAVGFSLSVLNAGIALGAVIIGLTAFAFTMFGLHAGKKIASARLSQLTEILGGLILLGIGVKILFEHDAFGFLY
ncbi:MAG: manganese efflux pump MntP family protein [Desulfohalobiaceae bacterium]|nr:manganese efflux pump MntP family protein [Desulfohalobiaceae bacterium]